MKKPLIGAAMLTACLLGATSIPSTGITAGEAFIRLDPNTMALLEPEAREAMVKSYLPDSTQYVLNTLYGLSALEHPLTDSYLRAELTPVSQLTIRVLPGKKGDVVAMVYTVGDSLTAHDSELRFYDASMRELKPAKHIKTASLKDFFDFHGATHEQEREALESVPFPTIEYTLSPDATTLQARFTAEEHLTREAFDKIKPWLRPILIYRWNGDKFELQK